MFGGSSIKPKQTVSLMKQLKTVLAIENWVGTACVLETASRSVSIGGELRGLINEAVWRLQYETASLLSCGDNVINICTALS